MDMIQNLSNNNLKDINRTRTETGKLTKRKNKKYQEQIMRETEENRKNNTAG